MPDAAAVQALIALIRDYGWPLAFAIALFFDVLVAGPRLRRAEKRADDADARLDKFMDVVEAATGIKAPKP